MALTKEKARSAAQGQAELLKEIKGLREEVAGLKEEEG